MRNLYGVLIFFLLVSSAAGQENYILFFDQPMADEEKILLIDELNSFDQRLSIFFKKIKESKTRIYFKKTLPGNRFPEWGVGFFVSNENAIYLQMRSYSNRETFYRVMRHEIVHAWIDDFVKREIHWPLWFEEGLCDYLSGRRIDFQDAQRLSIALTNNNIISLDSLTFLPLNHPYKIQYFYLQSFFIVQLLAEEGILNNLVFSKSWSLNDFNIPRFSDWIDFEIWWQTELENRYKWYIFLNFESAFAILIVILFPLAYISKIIQMRKRKKELSDLDEKYL